MDIDKIENRDCIEGMADMDDCSIDAVICDLPYGTTQNRWDSIIPFDRLWEQYERICKPAAPIILFGQMPFASAVIQSNVKLFRYEWIWVKNQGTGFLNANRMPLKAHENILIFYKNMPEFYPVMRSGYSAYKCRGGVIKSSNYGKYGEYTTESNGERYPIDILYFNSEKNNIHPTQKPVGLIEYLIKTYTKQGDLILDNCMGSGTTAIAAIRTNRHFIGFETDVDYFNKAINRIEIEKMQPSLFYDD